MEWVIIHFYTHPIIIMISYYLWVGGVMGSRRRRCFSSFIHSFILISVWVWKWNDHSITFPVWIIPIWYKYEKPQNMGISHPHDHNSDPLDGTILLLWVTQATTNTSDALLVMVMKMRLITLAFWLRAGCLAGLWLLYPD